MTTDDTIIDSLATVTAKLPNGGEVRSGQADMAAAVAAAIVDNKHLLVQAGTGTGKSLAYLVPIALSGQKTIVATATKALQDQLASKDLPHLVETLMPDLKFAVLKGRSNYICRQRVDELGDDNQMQLKGTKEALATEIEQLVEWAETTDSGDRATLKVEPSHAAWEKVSVGLNECPGASKCPKGESCFAEDARERAAEADIIVVNTHLYGIHLASEHQVLPEHDIAVIDEAHQFEEVISNTSGVTLGAGRFTALANTVTAIVSDQTMVDDLRSVGDLLAEALDPLADKPVDPAAEADLANALLLGQERANQALKVVRKLPTDKTDSTAARAQRAIRSATALLDDIETCFAMSQSEVAWVQGGSNAQLRIAPIDVGELLGATLWPEVTAVLTSATLPKNASDRLGLPDGQFETLDVGSPFDYESNALLYCPAHLPQPNSGDYQDEMLGELEELILAAGGRTLALFTSWRMMNVAAEHLYPLLPWKVMTQLDMPKQALIEEFTDNEESCLFATMSFWQGVDVPGPALSLVVLDRIPFPRPDDPLLQAKRDREGPRAFGAVDLPRAATLLAQGAGRLIRRGDDEGVVAVLDSRLANKRAYRWELINSLPPFARTRDKDVVLERLRALRDQNSGSAP